MSQFDESIAKLAQTTLTLLEQLDHHLVQFPSARLAHYRPSTLLAAIQREASQEPGPATAKADPFAVEMAEKLGITPSDFVELQAKRRSEMRRE